METLQTMGLQEFWGWLTRHFNCIIRAGTPDAVFYDSELLHWHLESEESGLLSVQIYQGKSIMGEFFVDPETVDFVQTYASADSREHTFELISEAGADRFPVYLFVMAHSFEQDDEEAERRVH